MEHKFHYFYKITNLINGHFYYGVHSTDDLNDGYMGSGTRLKRAIKKYGIENFKKDILKHCQDRKEAYDLESSIVTEALMKDDDCYNILRGGEQFTTEFLVAVKDCNDNHFLVHKDDPRYKSGELVGVTKGYFNAIDENGKCFQTKCENIGKNGIHGYQFGKVCVKDKNGSVFSVRKDDERYLKGEVVPLWVGKKHKSETIEKLKKTFKKINHQKGEKNSQYGTCWITKNCENKKIKKEELTKYIDEGWKMGRYVKKKK